jgi:histone-lysine N-methyltransferase SETMAR
VTDFMAARGIKLIEHPPYSPNLAPADYFLFPRIKRELAGLTLTQNTLQEVVGGGRQESYSGGLRRSVPAMVSATRKVCFDRRRKR